LIDYKKGLANVVAAAEKKGKFDPK